MNRISAGFIAWLFFTFLSLSGGIAITVLVIMLLVKLLNAEF